MRQFLSGSGRAWVAAGVMLVLATQGAAQTAPTISRQPQGVKIAVGDAATLQVVATGSAPINYQWRKNGAPIAGATLATLALAAAQFSDAGNFSVVVSNTAGSATSAEVALSVVAPARIANLSIRTGAGAGAETLIVGVTIGAGTGTLPALVRGIGPGLAAFGVTDALAALRLSVYAGGALETSNDAWGGVAEIAGLAQQVGAFALSPNSQDAALATTLRIGNSYTVQIAGARGATGVALAELYDATPAAVAAAGGSVRLTNCSARARVDTGAGILIAGFAIAGEVPKRILVRGIGPGLRAFGVTGTLGDPLLTVYQGQSLVAFNDDWSEKAAELTPIFAQVGAFALAAGSHDAALTITLAPGSYTAQISGFAGGTGVALVEVYELP